ncbi:MAG: molybdopterin-binding protein [Oscillospiraceae bacterium]
MKLIETTSAVGHVICHDITQIIPGVVKDARFRKGHIVTEEDIPVLLSLGKEHLYVWEKNEGMLHEDEAAQRLRVLCQGEHMRAGGVKEGKIELRAEIDGLFRVDIPRLDAINTFDDIMIATRHGNTAVKAGDKLAGMRIIPLVIAEEILCAVEKAAGETPLLELLPYRRKTAAIIATGSEIKKGLITDEFTPVIMDKLAGFGIDVVYSSLPGDDIEAICADIAAAREKKADLILCTGGMSVDPDDHTPEAIKASGAKIVSYGAPVLPGAMFLLGYFEDGTPILGLPGCAMYARATIFDLVLPRVLADIRLCKNDIITMGHGGLCLGCAECHYPICPFGKGE